MKTDIPGHWVRANHARDLPRTIIALDTETTGRESAEGTIHTFRLGWTVKAILDPWGRVSSEEWCYWTDPFKLMDYLEESCPRDSSLWVFANNIFFDLQAMGFYRDYTMRGWRLDFVYDAQTTYMLIIKRDRLTMKALSVSNYWSASTRELGELLGEPKLDVDFATAGEDELAIYCFRDTEIALDAMARYVAMVREKDLGAFRLSRAAQAYGAWRHRFMKHRVFAHSHAEVRALEESAYMGGRVEAYRIGEYTDGPFACYDINSMYPFIMSRYRLPVKCIDYHDSIGVGDLAGLIAELSCIAEVELDTDQPLYAYKREGKVIFPVGRFTAYLCTEGCRQAIMRGHARRIKRAAFYRDNIIFREYIDTFYAMRQEAKARGDRVLDKMAKLLMNSLYGKLAQRRPIVVSDGPCPGDDYFRQEIFDMVTRQVWITTRLFHRETVTAGDEIVPGAVVSIPAHITEYGRMLLYSIQESAGRDRVLYCDTDSVFLREDQEREIGYTVDPSTLGALSRKWQSSRLAIYGAKDYETDNERALKGVPSDAEQIGSRTWMYTFWPGQRTHMAERLDDYYVQRTVIKRAMSPYEKGRVNDDGSVSPWKLPDDWPEDTSPPGFF